MHEYMHYKINKTSRQAQSSKTKKASKEKSAQFKARKEMVRIIISRMNDTKITPCTEIRQESKQAHCQILSAREIKEACKQITTLFSTKETRKHGGKRGEQSK